MNNIPEVNLNEMFKPEAVDEKSNNINKYVTRTEFNNLVNRFDKLKNVDDLDRAHNIRKLVDESLDEKSEYVNGLRSLLLSANIRFSVFEGLMMSARGAENNKTAMIAQWFYANVSALDGYWNKCKDLTINQWFDMVQKGKTVETKAIEMGYCEGNVIEEEAEE